jgi:pimeloyl-ACP methyl ester carboxylesterase
MTGTGVRLTTLVAAVCLLVAACSDPADQVGSTEPGSAEGPSMPSNGGSGVIEGTFDVGGHELYMRCSGTGSPTIVYLHGYITDPSFSGSSSASAIQFMLQDRYRMCVYDRANVGESDSVPGPLDGTSSVTDLHGLLDATGIEPPYVLLAASFGGLIAHLYSATYPDDVVGMVYLDCSLPADVAEIDKRFDPGVERPGWEGTVEQIDQWATYAQAYEVEGDAPKIPLTYLASFDIPPEPQIAEAVRNGQREYVEMFSPGRFIVLDVPHYMEPEIPERIVSEIEKVIAQA